MSDAEHDPLVRRLRNALDKLEGERERITKDYDKQVHEVDKKIHAYLVVIGEQETLTNGHDDLEKWASLVAVADKMDRKDLFQRLAFLNEEFLRASEVNRFLILCGLRKAGSATSRVWHWLDDDERFEKVEPGLFKYMVPEVC